MPKRPAPPKPRASDTRPVNQRGQEWQAEKLTGARAQKGNLPGGRPRWTYEVKWKGTDPKTKKPHPTTSGEGGMRKAVLGGPGWGGLTLTTIRF